MSEPHQPDVIGSLPSTRPHRRSAKRAPVSEAESVPKSTHKQPAPKRAAAPKPTAAKRAATPKPAAAKRATTPKPTAAKRAATPKPARAKPAAARTHASEGARTRAAEARTPAAEPAPTPGALQTAVEAAVELTEIGLRIGAQTLRSALSRLPRS
ncbi:MAG TPA: hypothetical protein VFW09_00860 [Solirubrobacteraceae bacterium]|nr:hypothetical protein [Solirubrobacteraceae bacterium]